MRSDYGPRTLRWPFEFVFQMPRVLKDLDDKSLSEPTMCLIIKVVRRFTSIQGTASGLRPLRASRLNVASTLASCGPGAHLRPAGTMPALQRRWTVSFDVFLARSLQFGPIIQAEDSASRHTGKRGLAGHLHPRLGDTLQQWLASSSQSQLTASGPAICRVF